MIELSNCSVKWHHSGDNLVLYNRYLKFLELALEASEYSDVPRFKYGSVLVHRNRVISAGCNKTKTHPLQYKLNQNRAQGKRDRSYIHSEVDALMSVDQVPKNATLYIARQGLTGKLLLARPCEGCMSLIRALKIKTIVYTTPDGFAVEHILGE